MGLCFEGSFAMYLAFGAVFESEKNVWCDGWGVQTQRYIYIKQIGELYSCKKVDDPRVPYTLCLQSMC